MASWPAVRWITPDGRTGSRLFATMEEAQRWGGDEWLKHPDWKWTCDEVDTIPDTAIFTVDREAVGSFADLVRKTLTRFYAERADRFLVRDWGAEAVAPLRPFARIEGPDGTGLVTVVGRMTPDVAGLLVRMGCFELFLWDGDRWLFGLDDWTDLAFLLTEPWMQELEQLGVDRGMVCPESLEGHGYAFSRLPRPDLGDL